MDRNEPEQNSDLFPNRTKPSRNIPACNRETMRQPVCWIAGRARSPIPVWRPATAPSTRWSPHEPEYLIAASGPSRTACSPRQRTHFETRDVDCGDGSPRPRHGGCQKASRHVEKDTGASPTRCRAPAQGARELERLVFPDLSAVLSRCLLEARPGLAPGVRVRQEEPEQELT